MSSELTAGLLSEYSEPTDLPQTKMLSEQLNAPANEVPTTVLVTSVSTSENHNDTDIEEEKNKSINNGPGYPTTELNEIPKIVAELRKNFYQENPTSYNYRVTQLKNLLKLMQENSDELCKVCQSYFGGFERKFYLNRFFTLESEIASMANNLSSYMKGSKCKMPIAFFANWKANVIPVARGVVAIIAPWNFPIWLLIKPLIGAIAAGNAIVIKPSEITGDVAILLTKLITKYLDNKMIRIVNGGVPETTKLLEEKFDYIFFTGSPFVGKIVMKAASKHLTPLTLELGGQNPVIIDDNCNFETTMKRVVRGRWEMNAGQICVGAEYIMISENKLNETLKCIKKCLNQFFIEPTKSKRMIESKSYGRIVNKNHFDRLNKIRQHYLTNKEENNKVYIGGNNDHDGDISEGIGEANREERYMPPMAIVIDSSEIDSAEIAKDEVFGPFLTIITFSENNIDKWKAKAVDMIRSQGEPLVCYVYSPNNNLAKYFHENVACGAVIGNECVTQLAMRTVPFGGVGQSGMGQYGGKFSFDTFSHFKPIAICDHGGEAINDIVIQRYPPTDFSRMLKILELFYREKLDTPAKKAARYICFGLILAGVAYLLYFLLAPVFESC